MGSGSWGTAFAHGAVRRGQPGHPVGSAAELAATINSEHRNLDYFPTIPLPETAGGGAATRTRRWPVPTSSSWPCRRSRCGPIWRLWRIPGAGDRGQPGQGHGARHRTADERGHRRGRPGSTPSGSPWSPVPTWPGRSPSVSPRPVWWPASGRRPPRPCRRSCHTPRFRAYTNTDVIGCELGGATKNVIALAVGMAIGLGLGANATASVITRGLAEISRLGRRSAPTRTRSPDWPVWAIWSRPARRRCRGTGPSARNSARAARSPRSRPPPGRWPRGSSPVRRSANWRAQHAVEMPIVENVAAVVAGELTPVEMITALMSRSAKPERY